VGGVGAENLNLAGMLCVCSQVCDKLGILS